MAHPKGVLIERLQKQGVGKPSFKTKATGPDHEPTFITDVVVAGEVYGTGQGGTKKDAERAAAEEALRFLESSAAAPADRAPNDEPIDEPDEHPDDAFDEALHDDPVDPDDDIDDDLDDDLDGVDAYTDPDEPFEGPWPIFESILNTSLQIADRRVAADRNGEDAMEAVRDLALKLYKETLEDLGEVVEVGEGD